MVDPLAHTLVGASLARTRLGRRSAYATPTAILGANAPDVDAVTMLIDRDLSLGFRRGWTHGVLAAAVLPVLLAGLVWVADRAIARARGQPPRARAGPLLALSFAAVATHPALDWLNTYGVRLLMPFDGRWFYGDALFIIDPWVWLLAGTAVVAAHSRSAASVSAWMVLGAVLTGLVTVVGDAQLAAILVWLAGVAAIAGVGARGVASRWNGRLAAVCLACAAAYMAAMVAGSRIAERQVAGWLAERDAAFVDVMAGPLPARPLARDVVVDDGDHYHFLEVDWLRADSIRVSDAAIDRGPRGPIVDAALAHAPGTRRWLRFPAFTVEPIAGGHRVTIRDVRYSRRPGVDFPNVVVELDHDLRRIP